MRPIRTFFWRQKGGSCPPRPTCWGRDHSERPGYRRSNRNRFPMIGTADLQRGLPASHPRRSPDPGKTGRRDRHRGSATTKLRCCKPRPCLPLPHQMLLSRQCGKTSPRTYRSWTSSIGRTQPLHRGRSRYPPSLAEPGCQSPRQRQSLHSASEREASKHNPAALRFR